MAIYIEGIKMPKDGEHHILIAIHSDGTVEYNPNKGDGWQMTTAVSIPPHGRLIDADAMIHEIEKTFAPSWYIKERNADMVKFLSLEDTIISADPAEEGKRCMTNW